MKTHDWRPSLLLHPTLGVSSENLKAPVSLHEAGWYFQVTFGSLSPDSCTKGHAPQDHTAEPHLCQCPRSIPALGSKAPGRSFTPCSRAVLKGLYPTPQAWQHCCCFL